MSQSDTDKTLAAEERSEETRSFVRRVRSATRRKYSPEEKIRIVLEGFLEGHSIRPEVSNSNFPGFNSNPNTGHKVADDAEMQVANRYVVHDCARMSHVLLPVIRS